MSRFNPTVNDPLREFGHFSYLAGSGTATAVVPADYRVVGISATAGSSPGSIIVGAGSATLAIPANGSVDWEPKGNFSGPGNIYFDTTLAYVVEMVDNLAH